MKPIAADLPHRPPAAPTPETEQRRDALRAVAVNFEAMFLTQVLDLAGVGKSPEGFDGGHGEEAFRGHLLAEQGRLMAESGGIGLAEHVFQALLKREGLDA
ncbi:MAG: rod-binding protein [Rubrimonas sp.]